MIFNGNALMLYKFIKHLEFIFIIIIIARNYIIMDEITILIYSFYNKATNEVFYVGQTSDLDLTHYIKSKYWKLNEVKKGGRRWNGLFRYLDSHNINDIGFRILDIAHSKEDGNKKEKEQILIAKNKGLPIVNEADGGFGGNTYKYKTKEQMKVIGEKIKSKLKGMSKPYSQRETLSKIRKGSNNPSAKRYDSIKIYKNDVLISEVNYAFEMFDIFSKSMASSILSICRKNPDNTYIGKKGKYIGYKVIIE